MEVLGGQTIKSPGNFMNCRENRYIFCNPPSEDGEREGRTGGRKGEGGRQGRRGPSEAG